MKTELNKLMLVGAITTFVITLPLKNLWESFLLMFSYLFFFYMPFLPLVIKIKTGFLEKFLLTNLIGLSYGFVYVILDVFLHVPLNKFVFVLTTIIIGGVSWFQLKK